MAKHSYDPACQCTRCARERTRRAAFAQADQARRSQYARPRRNSKPRTATREEQHARYIDCGPLAWDDRD